ncbi:M20 family metallopeptidase [Pendulispora brunnea]|uniref:M20 family metallopeptidase n=2 Tax=Pendulispora brunnea TaxID=2905690 RepID=A0ABZ2KSK0_9BACT
MSMLNVEHARDSAERIWEDEIVPQLTEYIRIPNKSPSFDPAWNEHGHMERAVALIERWCRAQPIPGLRVEVLRLPNRTPLIFMEIPASADQSQGKAEGIEDTVLLYGHLDKQPEFTGWREGLGPWTPVREGDRLYGRGGADDGYSSFAALTALRLLSEQKVPHARCVVVIEASEESGSHDLPAYIETLGNRIGQPSLVICLDSGCGNYEQLWSTTSLRGYIGGTLTVRVLTEGVHSGSASGIVPSTFRIARQLLSRIEDEKTGRVLLDALYTEIPQARRAQAEAVANVLGDEVWTQFPWAEGAHAVTNDRAEALLAHTWAPALSVTGAAGLPPLENAGNVLRPVTQLKLSMRIPPRVDPTSALRALRSELERDPPYGAQVRLEAESGASGWSAPETAPWLTHAMDEASLAFFGKPSLAMGEGGTIPFMAMLGEKFPKAQFVITGVLGPQSNAHGPNEFLHLPTAKKVSCAVASILAAHATR